jgi:flagellar biosynthesis/type III secretory pathway chaperone
MMPGFRLAPRYDADTLQAELAGYRALLDVLHREQDALRRADADALPALAAAKQREVQALANLATARSEVLAAAGLCATRVAAEAVLVEGGADPAAVRAAWAELEALVAEARRVNAQNGVLIDVQQSYFGRALAALSGAVGQDAVYGADGRHRFGLGSRPLAAI